MGATPLYLVIILARANAYSRASATLHLSGTVQLIAYKHIISPDITAADHPIQISTSKLSDCIYYTY